LWAGKLNASVAPIEIRNYGAAFNDSLIELVMLGGINAVDAEAELRRFDLRHSTSFAPCRDTARHPLTTVSPMMGG
jgi:hypothetical protein